MATLKTKRDFDIVYKNALRIFEKSFTLYVLDLNSAKWRNLLSLKDDKTKLIYGLSVSKKIGSAPKRNLIKRRLRALLNIYNHEITNLALIFVPRGVFEFDVLKRDFSNALEFYKKSSKSIRAKNVKHFSNLDSEVRNQPNFIPVPKKSCLAQKIRLASQKSEIQGLIINRTNISHDINSQKVQLKNNILRQNSQNIPRSDLEPKLLKSAV